MGVGGGSGFNRCVRAARASCHFATRQIIMAEASTRTNGREEDLPAFRSGLSGGFMGTEIANPVFIECDCGGCLREHEPRKCGQFANGRDGKCCAECYAALEGIKHATDQSSQEVATARAVAAQALSDRNRQPEF